MDKQYTKEEIKGILIDKFNSYESYKINFDCGKSDYIDDSFDSVFDCIIETIKELGIKVNE